MVYKALDLHSNRHVALKKIRLETEDEGIPVTGTLVGYLFYSGKLSWPLAIRANFF